MYIFTKQFFITKNKGRIGKENDIIARAKDFRLEFSCVFVNEIDLNLENGVTTKDEILQVIFLQNSGNLLNFTKNSNSFYKNKIRLKWTNR